MNFFELKAALVARGYTYLSQEQQGNYINRARARIDNLHHWPYRLTTTTSVASITDMGHVDSVLDSSLTVPLQEVAYDDLFPVVDLTLTGPPSFWYRTSAGVATWPVTTNTVTVRYWKRTPVLTETDTPAMPTDYHLLIVDVAEQMVLRGRGQFSEAGELQGEIDRQVAEMSDDLLAQSEARFTRTTDSSTDW